MKKQTFEDYLREVHCRENSRILDDDLPDHFDNWLVELGAEDFDLYANEYATQVQKKDMRKNTKQLKGYAVYNPCMPESVERFFSGSSDTYKKGMPENNKELCEEYIQKNHSGAVIYAVPATLVYEIPKRRRSKNS